MPPASSSFTSSGCNRLFLLCSWTSFLWHALLLLLPQAGEAWSGRLVPSMQASNQQRPRPQEGKPVTRRHFQSGLLASVMAGALMGGPGARAEEDGAAVVEALPPPEVAPLPKSRLLERINDPEIKNPGLAGFGSPTMVYLPRWVGKGQRQLALAADA